MVRIQPCLSQVQQHTDGETVIIAAFQAAGRGSIPLRCMSLHYFSDNSFVIVRSSVYYRPECAKRVELRHLTTFPGTLIYCVWSANIYEYEYGAQSPEEATHRSTNFFGQEV
jgi:hypothetical protein